MVGVIFVAHENIAQDMICTAETILGKKLDNFRSLRVPFELDVSGVREELTKHIAQLDTGDGVLLLTDFFGGTPSNICISVLGRPNIELVYGTNLAMIIKLASCCDKYSLQELAPFIKKYGVDHINFVHSEKELK